MVPLDVLWCQCQGNASATPHMQLIHAQVAQMHADATHHALCYVGVVLALYLLGLVVIIRRSGRLERQTAASALASCLCGALSAVGRLFSAVAAVGRPRPPPDAHPQAQQQQPVRTTISLPAEPLPPMPGTSTRGLKAAKATSPQIHLVLPDDDDEMEISMVTSISMVT